MESLNNTPLPPAQQRAQTWQTLEHTHWDVLVVGGGASGLGVALDCTLRGLRTALVEAGDYASATSGASTKLIHGGVRYLEKAVKELDFGQYRLVREALSERRGMIVRASHLAHPQGIVLPVYSAWQRFYYGLGLKVYDAMAGGGTLISSQTLNSRQAKEWFPLIETRKQKGGILFYDGQFDDAAYANVIAQSAIRAGATLLNHCRVQHLGPCRPASGRSVGIRNEITGETLEVQARVVVNCTGHFADTLRKWANPGVAPRIRPSKGIHIMIPMGETRLKAGMLIPKTDDGRVVFVLPWNRSLLIGTTDTEMSDAHDAPTPTAQDVDYLLEQTNRFLERPLRREELQGAFGGVRPLVAKTGAKKTEALIRDHEVECWPRQGIVNLLGGKWTTYRFMAQDATDAVFAVLGQRVRPCRTAQHLLVGCPAEKTEYGYTENHLPAHLARYGTEAEVILRGNITPLHPRHTLSAAEVAYFAQHQQAVTVQDALCNRLRLGLENCATALEVAPAVATELEKLHGMNAQLGSFQTEMNTRLASLGKIQAATK